MVEPLTIIHAGGTIPLNGSVVEPDSTINSQGIRVVTNKTLFIVNTIDLGGVKMQRGIRIHRGSAVYEVIIDKDLPTYSNDPNNIETVIPGKLLCS